MTHHCHTRVPNRFTPPSPTFPHPSHIPTKREPPSHILQASSCSRAEPAPENRKPCVRPPPSSAPRFFSPCSLILLWLNLDEPQLRKNNGQTRRISYVIRSHIWRRSAVGNRHVSQSSLGPRTTYLRAQAATRQWVLSLYSREPVLER